MSTCPDCERPKAESLDCWLKDSNWGTCAPVDADDLEDGDDDSLLAHADCMRRTADTLRQKLAATEAKLVETERALATETKAREMSWAHHDEHHERDNARWLKMCQTLGKLASDGSPGIAWPAIFELVTGLQRETEAWRALVNQQRVAVRSFGDEVHLFGQRGQLVFIGKSAHECARDLGLLDKGGG